MSKPEDVAPSEDYCGKWNEKQQKEIDKRIQKDTALIESLPRVYAKNFDDDYAGMTYESLDILECIDARYEAKPDPTIIHTPTQKKSWRQVVVYKRYKCRCYLCGKEQEVSCDKFGIYPPTGYGYHAYYGYWSNLSCDCHPISSFQWIVNKLLFENRVPYHVEYSFPDLYGIREQNLLRFDFAIFNEDGSLKCLIECQGEQHYKPVDEFGGINQLKSQVANDEVKRQYAKNHHIPLIEITYKEKKYEKVESILKQQGII